MCGRKMNCEVQPQHVVAVGFEASHKSRPADKNRYQFAWMDTDWADEEEQFVPPGRRNTAFPFVAVRAVQGHFVADVDDRRAFRLLDNNEEIASHLRPLIHGTLLSKVPAILLGGLIPAGGGLRIIVSHNRKPTTRGLNGHGRPPRPPPLQKCHQQRWRLPRTSTGVVPTMLQMRAGLTAT